MSEPTTMPAHLKIFLIIGNLETINKALTLQIYAAGQCLRSKFSWKLIRLRGGDVLHVGQLIIAVRVVLEAKYAMDVIGVSPRLCRRIAGKERALNIGRLTIEHI